MFLLVVTSNRLLYLRMILEMLNDMKTYDKEQIVANSCLKFLYPSLVFFWGHFFSLLPQGICIIRNT